MNTNTILILKIAVIKKDLVVISISIFIELWNIITPQLLQYQRPQAFDIERAFSIQQQVKFLFTAFLRLYYSN